MAADANKMDVIDPALLHTGDILVPSMVQRHRKAFMARARQVRALLA